MQLSIERNGSNWIQTYTGRAFYPLDPKPEDIDIRDIAHALAHTCRYAGHTRYFYSVAEHSIYVSAYCQDEYALWGLLHDASEAYIQDIPRPLKPYLTNYHEIEERLMRVIAERFNLPWPIPPAIKKVDTRILLNEKHALMGPEPQPWSVNCEPLEGLIIQGWEPYEAKASFLIAYSILTGGSDGLE